MENNILIFHGGGPTAVLNASLYGAVMQARESPGVGKIMAARGGSGGLMREDFIDLRAIPDAELALLLQSPGSAIGTSRDRLREDEYARMAGVVGRHGFNCVLGNGGNGTMDTCGKLAAHCGEGVRVVGIPKTMDNDIAVTDHCPGYGSAARFVAGSAAELAMDVRSMPIHVVVLEAMGRNTGWLTAAAALAKQGGCPGPDLIYLPERPFNKAAFLGDAERLHRQKGGVLVVASEGLKDGRGQPVVEPVLTMGRDVYFGDVSAHLAKLVMQELGIKARSEKPGLLGRASIAWQSTTDRAEAELCGRAAVQAALAGETAQMVALRRGPGPAYSVSTFLVPIGQVMMEEKTMPDAYINAEGNGVTEEFLAWCAPLIGAPLPPMVGWNGAG